MIEIQGQRGSRAPHSPHPEERGLGKGMMSWIPFEPDRAPAVFIESTDRWAFQSPAGNKINAQFQRLPSQVVAWPPVIARNPLL